MIELAVICVSPRASNEECFISDRNKGDLKTLIYILGNNFTADDKLISRKKQQSHVQNDEESNLIY